VLLEPWDVDRAADLAALLDAALPAEGLTADELAAVLWDDPAASVVLGTGDAQAAVAACVRDHGRPVGFVRVVAVHPGRRRAGIGTGLLTAAHQWLGERGAVEVRTGGDAPRYLWPGLDVDAHAAAVALATAAGSVEVARAGNHRCATTHRAEPPAGISLRRLAGGEDAERALALAARHWPGWVAELAAAVGTGCAHGAFDDATGDCAGFACHSVNRAGWIGPMATDPARHGRGVGSALLGAVCRDLAWAEIDEAEIAWVGPGRFYERAAGATPSRRFVVLSRPVAGPAAPGSRSA
jgi:GNAT superfamily N-acetyltransferase